MNIKNAKLPPIYQRNGKDCYFDPIRKRLIYITPEETIRQLVLSYLMETLHVPANMIQVEERLSHYGLQSADRADIVVLGRNMNDENFPLAVIECKAETVLLDEKAANQAFDYSDALGSDYTLLINGVQDFCYRYDNEKQKYIRIAELPGYAAMLDGKCTEIPPEEPPERLPYEELEKELRFYFSVDDDDYCMDISKYTPMRLALPCFNLWEGLLDYRVKLPCRNYGLFTLIEDCGVRMMTYGNGGGGKFFGPYRSFLVNTNGNTELFSIGFATYLKASWVGENGMIQPDKHPLTCICVAHDDEKSAHHALQLLVDEDAVVYGENTVRFYHAGRIAIGRIGSGKKAGLRELVEKRYPKILTEDRYYLGSITADHLLRLDEPNVIDLIVNLISYAIVRDEYRESVKAHRAEKREAQ